jgi:hypothetical protein
MWVFSLFLCGSILRVYALSYCLRLRRVLRVYIRCVHGCIEVIVYKVKHHLTFSSLYFFLLKGVFKGRINNVNCDVCALTLRIIAY